MNLNEVPYSIVLSHQEYVDNISDLSVFCRDSQKDYILVKQNINRQMIHFTSPQCAQSILSTGLLVIDKQGLSSFGDGIYAFPTVLQRQFYLDDCVGVVFNTNNLDYYICVDGADSIAPIGYAFFTQNIPKENITGVIDHECINTYLNNQNTDINDTLFLCGMDWTSKEVLKLVGQSNQLAKDLPDILTQLRSK